ncbi:SDR family oxidoreductase [Cedecea davisae]|uniref:SDR family oxidoreductase n=1 Tax=Cedecea davisae TaxID=158484 RepID=A0ABS6DHF9_9ENTR|nr:SDR family oxidoreductase [Cedecea davisae]MBU4682641.1 SDR family oxidoreductase [Cedecea davisae]MBU4687529.1 SDR family oxidoreductase [Cedecea davisae]
MADSLYAIVGGSSGIGLALAHKLTARGNKVLLGGRSEGKLNAAVEQLGPLAEGKTVDITDRDSLKAFFSGSATLTGLFTPAASYSTGNFRDGDIATSEGLFQAKFWAQYWAVYEALPYLQESAAVVLMSGAASARPIGAPAYAACNAALEGLARGLAVELNPIRVNCLSPGTTDSELWRNRDAAQRESAYQYWNSLALVGRPASVQEQAASALFLLDNGNMTGSTLYCDGGYTLR